MRLPALAVLAAVAAGCGDDAPVRTVEVTAVSSALVDAASREDRTAVGASCTPPPERERLEATWDCGVEYQGSPQLIVKFRLDVAQDGCWTATEVDGARRLRGCGLRIRPAGS